MRRANGRLTVLVVAIGLVACGSTPRSPAADHAGAQAPTDTAAPLSHQDQLLLATAKVALPPPGISPADLPDPNSRGAKVLNGYCTQCHPLPSPAMHAASDWPGVVRRMWLRVERLPASEHVEAASIGDRVTLLNYLMANALQVSGTTLPPGQGRETYSVYCSRCHALPDPKVHAPQDWQAVVMRMERNIERMDVTPMPRDSLGRILEYLQGPAEGR